MSLLHTVVHGLAVALLVMPFAIVETAIGQQPTPQQAASIRAACRADFMSHCADVQPGGREALRQPTQQQVRAIRSACRSDFTSHCAGVQPGGREALQCLQRNRAQVSQPCQTALAAVGGAAGAASPGASVPAATPAPAEPLKPRRRLRPREELAILRICSADWRALCGVVPAGGGRIIRCLARNAERLSPRCRAALAELGG